jgi:hypothetical protein
MRVATRLIAQLLGPLAAAVVIIRITSSPHAYSVQALAGALIGPLETFLGILGGPPAPDLARERGGRAGPRPRLPGAGMDASARPCAAAGREELSSIRMKAPDPAWGRQPSR